MKKFTVILMAVLLAVSIVPVAEGYTPGEYTASAKGNNADVPVKVQVTFSENAITDIKILQHEETPGLGDKAFEKMIPAIIAAC